MGQIKTGRYGEQLYLDGLRSIIKCGIACHVKSYEVVFGNEERL